MVTVFYSLIEDNQFCLLAGKHIDLMKRATVVFRD